MLFSVGLYFKENQIVFNIMGILSPIIIITYKILELSQINLKLQTIFTIVIVFFKQACFIKKLCYKKSEEYGLI